MSRLKTLFIHHHEDIYVESIDKALSTHGRQLLHLLQNEKETFTDGAFIYVQSGISVERPLEIAPSADKTKIVLLLAPKSSLNVIHRLEVEEKAHISFTILLEEKSSLHIGEHSKGPGTHYEYKNVQVGEGASFSYATESSVKSRSKSEIFLNGKGARAFCKGLLFGEDQREVVVEHVKEETFSEQCFKRVLVDDMHASCLMKTVVSKEARLAEVRQSNHNLLLSERAHAVCSPMIEVFVDEVDANHKVTYGTVDQELLFYLQSRGFSEKEALDIYIEGFTEGMWQDKELLL